jgi:hypothetical protein
VLPEIKRIQASQKQLNTHLQDVIPIEYAADRETGWFNYRQFIDFMLQNMGCLK